jgi:hypothetical protein
VDGGASLPDRRRSESLAGGASLARRRSDSLDGRADRSESLDGRAVRWDSVDGGASASARSSVRFVLAREVSMIPPEYGPRDDVGARPSIGRWPVGVRCVSGGRDDVGVRGSSMAGLDLGRLVPPAGVVDSNGGRVPCEGVVDSNGGRLPCEGVRDSNGGRVPNGGVLESNGDRECVAVRGICSAPSTRS